MSKYTQKAARTFIWRNKIQSAVEDRFFSSVTVVAVSIFEYNIEVQTHAAHKSLLLVYSVRLLSISNRMKPHRFALFKKKSCGYCWSWKQISPRAKLFIHDAIFIIFFFIILCEVCAYCIPLVVGWIASMIHIPQGILQIYSWIRMNIIIYWWPLGKSSPIWSK